MIGKYIIYKAKPTAYMCYVLCVIFIFIFNLRAASKA